MLALETREELLAILFLHFSSLVFTQLHLQVHFSAIEIPLLSCSPLILSQTSHLLPLLIFHPALFCLLSSSCTLASLSPTFAESSVFSMSALLHLFPHRSPMQDCKHKAHNCSLWPWDFLVIAITMLAGLVMSLYSSLCPRSLQIQIKEGN